MSGIDTEKFIQDIYNKRIIWDRNCGSNKSLTESTWDNLSKEFEVTSKMPLYLSIAVNMTFASVALIKANTFPFLISIYFYY